MKTLEEFWSMVDKKEGGCWLWKGSREGSVNWHGRVLPVRRLAWMLQKNDKIDGSCRIQTSCNNKICVHEDHLRKKNVNKPSSKRPQRKPPATARRTRSAAIPTVIPDNTRLTALLQELVKDAEAVEKRHDEAMVFCRTAYLALDEVLMCLSRTKDQIDSAAEKAISVYREERFREFAERGRELLEQSPKKEDK